VHFLTLKWKFRESAETNISDNESKTKLKFLHIRHFFEGWRKFAKKHTFFKNHIFDKLINFTFFLLGNNAWKYVSFHCLKFVRIFQRGVKNSRFAARWRSVRAKSNASTTCAAT
jgi:hypothetical protein